MSEAHVKEQPENQSEAARLSKENASTKPANRGKLVGAFTVLALAGIGYGAFAYHAHEEKQQAAIERLTTVRTHFGDEGWTTPLGSAITAGGPTGYEVPYHLGSCTVELEVTAANTNHPAIGYPTATHTVSTVTEYDPLNQQTLSVVKQNKIEKHVTFLANQAAFNTFMTGQTSLNNCRQ